VLHLGDVVMVVGSADELAKMQFILGEETQERMDINSNILAIDVDVLEASLTGKKLAEMRGLGALHGGHHPHSPPWAGNCAYRSSDAGNGR